MGISPSYVDVGGNVTLVVRAAVWPAPASATVSFVSPHHGFTGSMTWEPSCTCFATAVYLARRVHPLENGRVVATVKSGGTTYRVYGRFTIRGLAKDGKTYAPGGPPAVSTWVSDPRPSGGEAVHFCAWARTPDSLGVGGLPVSFVVHYDAGNRTYHVAATDSTGMACISEKLPAVIPGLKVVVDTYVGSMHVQANFTPR